MVPTLLECQVHATTPSFHWVRWYFLITLISTTLVARTIGVSTTPSWCDISDVLKWKAPPPPNIQMEREGRKMHCALSCYHITILPSSNQDPIPGTNLE
jgi:hypothetical protein